MTDTATPGSSSILCAIDLSDSTAGVLQVAAEMAELYDEPLTVVHAVELWDNRYDFIVPDIATRIENEARKKLQEELKHLHREKAVPVDVVIRKGAPDQVILAEIKSRRPDMVIIGSHGRRGLDRLLLGSVADKILRAAPCSVLVVRPPKGPDIKSILCAVDFGDCSRTALERAIQIAKGLEIPKISVVHIFEVPMGYLEAGMTYETALKKTRDVHAREMDAFLKGVPGAEAMCQPLLEEGAPAATIVSCARKLGVDLLVVGAHGRSRLTALLVGGTPAKIVHQAELPVLAVKAPQHYQSLWQGLDKL